MRHPFIHLIRPLAFFALAGCQANGSGSATPEFAILTSPDGSRPFKDWPVDRDTLRGANLTSDAYANLKWTFNADWTHTVTNGGDSLPAFLEQMIKNPDYSKAKKAEGKWSIQDTAGNLRELKVTFEIADGRRPSMGGTAFVYAYHSSPRYIHFCQTSTGHGGFVLTFQLTPAPGQSLPAPR